MNHDRNQDVSRTIVVGAPNRRITEEMKTIICNDSVPSSIEIEAAPERQPYRTNVTQDQTHLKSIKFALNEISRIVSKSLGPFGGSTFIYDEELQHNFSKDGYSILKKIQFLQLVPNMILDLVRSVSRQQVRNVGDGSTSVVVITDKLFEKIYESDLISVFPSKLIHETILAVSKVLSDLIKEIAYKPEENDYLTNKDMVYTVAKLAANGDHQVASLIADIYSELGRNVNYVIDTTKETDKFSVSTNYGFKHNRGLVHHSFATEAVVGGVELSLSTQVDPLVIVSSEFISPAFFKDIFDNIILEKIKQFNFSRCSFCLIASEFSKDVVDSVIELNKDKENPLNITLIDHATISNTSKNRMSDLAAFLDCDIVTLENIKTNTKPVSTIVSKIKATLDETTISVNKSLVTLDYQKRIQVLIENLKDTVVRLENSDGEFSIEREITEIKKRISNLEGHVATIHVKGETRAERDNLAFLIEDATLAVKASLESGVVNAMMITVPSLIEIKPNIILESVRELVCEKMNLNKDSCAYDIDHLCYKLIEIFKFSYIDSINQILSNGKLVLDYSGKNNKAIDLKFMLENQFTFNLITHQYTSVLTRNNENDGKDIYCKIPLNKPISEKAFLNELAICPAKTEVQILKSVSSLVSVLYTSNQSMIPRISVGYEQD